jgi:hypothetical protein
METHIVPHAARSGKGGRSNEGTPGLGHHGGTEGTERKRRTVIERPNGGSVKERRERGKREERTAGELLQPSIYSPPCLRGAVRIVAGMRL